MSIESCKVADDQLGGLPSIHAKKMVNDIAKNNNLKGYNMCVKPGSAKGENYFGEIYKVHLESGSEKLDLILKAALDNPAFRENLPLRQYYCREIDGYMTVLPELHQVQSKYNLDVEDRFEFPKCYSTNNVEYKEALMIEDISVKDFRMYDRLISLDLDHAELAIKYLAMFHATSFSMRKNDPANFEKLVGYVQKKVDYGIHFEKFLNENKKQVLNVIEENDVHKKLSDYLIDAYEKLERFLDSDITEPYNVICHGDCWTSNILFKYRENKPIGIQMIDWQLLRLASPVSDIAYLICTSTDEKFRMENFQNLLDIYYDTLSSSVQKLGCDIAECYPKEIYREHIEKIFPFGLIISIALCPVLLSDRDDVPDLAVAGENYKNEKGSNIKLSKVPTSRLRGVVKDCIKYKFI